MGDSSDTIRRAFAFGIAIMAVAWALPGYAAPGMHTFYVEAAAAVTLVFLVMAFWLVRQGRRLAQTAAALRVSERRSAQDAAVLKATLDSIDLGVLFVEADLRVSAINRRAQELLGLPAAMATAELTMPKLLQWLWDAGEFGVDRALVETALRDFRRNGGLIAAPAIHTRQRPDGTVLLVCTTVLPSGAAVRTFTDITESERAEHELAAAKQAIEAEKLKSALLEAGPAPDQCASAAASDAHSGAADSDRGSHTEDQIRIYDAIITDMQMPAMESTATAPPTAPIVRPARHRELIALECRQP